MKKLKYIFIIISLFFIGCDNSALINTTNIMKVHYIDVGQGDSILIQVNNKNLLIDAGPKSNRKELLSFLDSLKIKKLHYIIATHPHEDHIGNMSSIIKKYDIDTFFAPKITHTSKSFEQMLEALILKNKKITILNTNTKSLSLGPNTKIDIFSPPHTNYGDNLNLYSPIFRIQYDSTSFLFTGDSEIHNENEILGNNYEISSDVLKLGHHGSSTSTSDNFYNKVNPKIVIISVGKDNSYSHPSKKLLSFLENKPITLYRTDKNSTITLISDGKSIYKK